MGATIEDVCNALSDAGFGTRIIRKSVAAYLQCRKLTKSEVVAVLNEKLAGIQFDVMTTSDDYILIKW